MSTSDSTRSRTPEESMSDWFGVEVHRPSDAPDLDRPRSPPSPSPGSYPSSEVASAALASRRNSYSDSTHELSDISTPSRSKNLLVGGLMLGVGLLTMFVTYSMGGTVLISFSLLCGGMIRLLAGLNDD